MALETASYINGLVATNPTATDTVAQADDHIRLIKAAIKATFPNVTGAITATQAEVNTLDGFTGTVTDLNYAKDLRATGVTNTEFDYLDGVTSNIQTQLNSKQPTITGAATTIDSANLTASRALVSDASGKVAASSTITSTELEYLNGVTSNIQTQLNNVSGYPLDIRVLTSGTSYTIPAGAKAILIRASGGGGGGSVYANPATSGLGVNTTTLGGDGGTTTVSNSTLGISITAAGGPNGTNMASDASINNWFTNVGASSAGGDIFYNAGASGGRSTTNNFDGGREDGGAGVLVQKYVTGTNVGGKVLSYSLGAGGTATSNGGTIRPEAGRAGYIELWIW